ncbi:MAG: RluA family pseudouridine synthase [Clostridium sp.]|nr:RluA family pseudouridine synthase [Clostridium sp.]
MQELRFNCKDYGGRIDSWLLERLQNCSRTYIKKLADGEMLLVNGQVIKPSYKLKPGDNVLLRMPKPISKVPGAENIKIPVLYEDQDILVIDKPKGMVVHPAHGNSSGTLVNALLGYCGEELSDINGVTRPGIVHRIDKDTSGVLVVAKNNTAHKRLSEDLKNRDVERLYVALVYGTIAEDRGKIDAPIGRHPKHRKRMAVNTVNGKQSITYFKVLERFKNATYLQLVLETGRTHQIRVHMSYIGHPVIGDVVYGRKKDIYKTNGQVLHARRLGFTHPIKGVYMEFESPLPKYFERLLLEFR